MNSHRTTANKLTRYTADDCKDQGLPAQQPPGGFIRESFISIDRSKLYTPSQVADLVEEHRAEAARAATLATLDAFDLFIDAHVYNDMTGIVLKRSELDAFIYSLRRTAQEEQR